MVRRRPCLLSILLVLLTLVQGMARPATPEDSIPKALQDWQAWVLKGQEFRRCPFLATGDEAPAESAYHCVWPERLVLAVDARGGRFSQRWQVYTDSWVSLPGDAEHWPEGVELDGRPAALVARQGVPSLRLTPGAHEVSGRWAWEVRPAALSIPPETALLDLSVDGARVPRPERPDGQVALGRQESTVEPRTLELQIFRLLHHDEPALLQTRLRIRAAGDAREESLGQVLPQGFAPLSLVSPVPARLNADGTLRVQIRPGAFELTLTARQTAAGSPLRMPQTGSLVRGEIWSFASDDRLGVVTLEGAPNVDPSQAQVPEEWRRHPAFEITPDVQLHLTEHSRGLSDTDQDRLTLEREMWLDFDHQGFTVRDRLGGTLRRDWRLDMHAPYELDSARADGDTLLVTDSARPGERGVELRSPHLALTAVSRLPHPFGNLPATGWTTGFESVSGTLYLPPGHRLIAVLGADESPTAWLNRWGLWNLFGVLVVIVFARWVAGWKVALIGGLGLLLSCQQESLQVLLWANLIAALALVRAVPEGRLARWARGYRVLSLVLLLLVLVPFAVLELRDSIHPQLDHEEESTAATYGGYGGYPPSVSGAAAVADVTTAAPAQPSPASAPMSPAKNEEQEKPHEQRRAAQAQAGARQQSFSNRNYAPGANVQAGPGVPNWSYGSHRFGWSGPVEAGQTVRFIVLPPLVVAAWRILGVALLAAFLMQLARPGRGRRLPAPQAQAAAAALLLALLAPPGHAQALPDEQLLSALHDRLTAPPPCTPSCAELLSAQIHVSGERIAAELSASALARVAIALPSAADRWQIDTVLVDGRSSLAVGRQDDAGLWVPLEPGVHTVHIEGRLFGDSLHLAFPMTPRQVAVDSPGWLAGGVSAGRLLSGALDLTRQQPAQDTTLGAGGADSQEFPPFVRVVRSFQLDADWSVTTTVERVSPSQAAFTVTLPLVAGESVLSEGTKVNTDGTVLVGLSAGEGSQEWTSSLPRGPALAVHLPALPARSEVWRFTVSPQWHVAFRGLPAVLPDPPDSTPWVFEYRPRPGEGLDLEVTQPPAVAGSTLAIDQVRHSIQIGQRTAEESLVLNYRSTQGGRQTLSLPADATVTQVTVDHGSVPIRPQRGELALSILPGEHVVEIDWRSPRGEALAGTPDKVDLHAPASNVRTVLSLPAVRWPLLALGPGVGPAFLYWSELAVFLVIAVLLGRSRWSPLSFAEWLLLGLGLSTLSWFVLLLVAVWLFAMSWRERAPPPSARWRFNLLQTALALLTVVAAATLVFSGIRYGLLSSPDMGVSGPGSYDHSFAWLMDHSASALPQPVVYSVPMWVYRAVMFAWALWIAFALARWLRFAWRAWISGGYWRTRQDAAAESAAG